MRQSRSGRVATGRYHRVIGAQQPHGVAQAADDGSRAVVKILGVLGSVASDDGAAARVRVQTSFGETDLEIDRGSLAGLLAAVAVAQKGCEEKSVIDRRVQFAHPARSVRIDELTDPNSLLLTLVLEEGQRMSFCVARQAFEAPAPL